MSDIFKFFSEKEVKRIESDIIKRILQGIRDKMNDDLIRKIKQSNEIEKNEILGLKEGSKEIDKAINDIENLK